MQVAERTVTGFDILGFEETETSMIRNETLVRLSWKNEENQLVQLVKAVPMEPTIGTLLISRGNCLLPTGDRRSTRTVAKLLAAPDAATQEKSVTIGGTTYIAKLLPVQLL